MGAFLCWVCGILLISCLIAFVLCGWVARFSLFGKMSLNLFFFDFDWYALSSFRVYLIWLFSQLDLLSISLLYAMLILFLFFFLLFPRFCWWLILLNLCQDFSESIGLVGVVNEVVLVSFTMGRCDSQVWWIIENYENYEQMTDIIFYMVCWDSGILFSNSLPKSYCYFLGEKITMAPFHYKIDHLALFPDAQK